jgi:hypothetical protein
MDLCEKQFILNHKFRLYLVAGRMALDKMARGQNGMAPNKFTNFSPEN